MKKKIIAFVALMLVSLMLFSLGARLARAEGEDDAVKVNAKAYYLTDFDGTVEIASGNKEERLPIASMVKIMTLDLVFEKIDEGAVSLADSVCVSENAASMGGSQAFLAANSVYSVEQLIKSVIVASANDSCVALAEHCCGSVDAFVSQMNEKAKMLGMNNTNFVNCTGLPADNAYSCAVDVYKMTRDLMSHDKFFDYSTVWMYDFEHPDGRKTTLTNTNKLSRFYKGCDGGKTGFTKQAGSCLSATAKRDDTRLICVVIGAPSAKERNSQVSKLLNYGFANYSDKVLYSVEDGSALTVDVEFGKTKIAGCYIEKPLTVFGKKSSSDKAEIKIEKYTVVAPVRKGDVVGKITAISDAKEVASADILAVENVEKRNVADVLREIAEKW